ncbi:MAG: hypothetical protein HY071_06040 [Chloroflexi bacterium]|nr:hypothetical protein [Chloroflexota bacterium]
MFFALWRMLVAAGLAILLARVDDYVDRTHGDSPAGKVWRTYRSRTSKTGKKVKRGAPPDAGSAIDTEGRPKA